MRILLVGEYSRLHNSLKEGLIALGHDVVLVSNGDGFKGFPSDYSIDAKWSKSIGISVLRKIMYRITKYDIATLEFGIRFYKILPKLKNFDVVQLISETPIQTNLSLEWWLLQKLKSQNKKLFVLSSGTDVMYVKALFEKKFRYSMLDPYLKNSNLIEEYRHLLQFRKPKYQKHHQKLIEITNGFIATDIDYVIPLEGSLKFLGMVPNPVNVEEIPFLEAPILDKIVIFHGINRWNYFKKGNFIFEQALLRIKEKYAEKVQIETVENVPYSTYIELYNKANIVMDQVFGYDQGYNALEAMAKGKVVFTGAETEFEAYYNLTENVNINALPKVEDIVSKLSDLIEHPEKIGAIGKKARAFVEEEHDYKKIAQQYLNLWNRN